MHKLLVNQALYAQGLQATQALGVFFDGIARHTPEGFAWQQLAAEKGFKEAVRERDEPFGDCRPRIGWRAREPRDHPRDDQAVAAGHLSG